MRVRSGQGLLETTIAIGVIVVGLFSVITLTRSNVHASEVVNLQFTATQLAREGVEVVRAIRDANWLAGDRSWDAGIMGAERDYTGIPKFDPVSAAWMLTYLPNDFTDAATQVFRRRVGDDAFLAQDAVGGGETDERTPYRRLLALDPICRSGTIVVSARSCDPTNDPKVGIRVRSIVRWASGGRSGEVIAEERLYDWR